MNINLESKFYRIKKITQLTTDENILGYNIETYNDIDMQTHNVIKFFIDIDDSQIDEPIMEFKITTD